MENIFEGRIIIDDGYNSLPHLIEEELSVVPLKLIKFVFDRGFKIYYIPSFDGDLKGFFIKYGLNYNLSEFKKDLKRYFIWIPSHVQFDKKAIIIRGNNFLKTGYPHSMVVHEFAHAIDAAFGDFLNGDLPKGDPLDFYAESCVFEKFAVAFEAFCHPERFCGDDYRIHNKYELFRKSSNIFEFFDQLFREWGS